MGKLYPIVVPITTAGVAGSATGSEDFAVPGAFALHAVHISGDLPATGDVTLNNLGRNIVVSTNEAAPVVNYPREQAQDAAGAAVPAGEADRWQKPLLNGKCNLSVAQANAGTVTVTLFVQPIS